MARQSPKTRKSAFASYFHALRLAHRLTQEDVARLAGVSRTLVGRYEGGADPASFTVGNMRRIAEVFRLPVDAVFPEAFGNREPVQAAERAAAATSAIR